MNNFRAPPGGDLPDELYDNGWTVLTTESDQELTDKQRNQLEAGSFRQPEKSASARTNLEPVTYTEPHPDHDHISWVKIDLVALWKLVYEHKRYSQAEGFSDSEMAVLKAVEFNRNERVVMSDIEDDYRIQDYSESTIYKALSNLEEKGLIDKPGHGVYRYIGP